MNEIIRPGAGILFMKVGTHATESLADIIERKAKEIDDTGYAMWGYGGNTCHPGSMVQPFAKTFADRGEPIHLVMEEMNSQHSAEPRSAAEYSVDGVEWSEIPETINVKGSRFALVINKLRAESLSLPLDQTQVVVGRSTGRPGSLYVKGRVDKACLEVMKEPARVNEPVPERPIHLVAELQEPYAVFLRNYR